MYLWYFCCETLNLLGLPPPLHHPQHQPKCLLLQMIRHLIGAGMGGLLVSSLSQVQTTNIDLGEATSD